MTKLGAVIREARIAQGLSIFDLGVSVEPSTVAAIEGGQITAIPQFLADEIADRLDIDRASLAVLRGTVSAQSANRVTAADSGRSLEIEIYGELTPWWWDSNSARSIARVLGDNGSATRIDVRINSPGGDYLEAVAIAQRLREHQATVVTHIDGLAASAASLIALAGDTVLMAQGAEFMIHEPSSGVFGNAADLERVRARLESTTQSMAQTYSRNSNLSEDEALAAMAAETTYSASEARAVGFVDHIVSGGDIVARARAKETTRMKSLLQRIAVLLALSDEATEAEVVSHVSALAKRAELAEAQVSDLKAQASVTAQEIGDIRAQLKQLTTRSRAEQADAFCARACSAGKATPGGTVEGYLREHYVRDPEGAEAALASMERITPVGAPRQSSVPKATANSLDECIQALHTDDLAVIGQTRVKPASFVQANYDLIRERYGWPELRPF